MIDYLDTYTRLELCQYSDILITYYCIGGKKMNQKLMLEGIVDFEYVVVNTEGENFNIPFFGQSMMIESIKLDNSDKLLYYNPYVSKELYEGDYIDEENVEIIKEKVLGKKAFDSKDKEKFHRIRNHVCEYLVKHNFEYNDLFFSEKQKREFEEFFEVLIKGITNYCEKNGLDAELKFINKGSTSLIYGIGDKIIKIGKPRRQSNIPYCEYVLQPIINRDYFFDDYPIHVEVTQKVLVCEDNKNIFKDNKEFDEILRDLIEKLREIGLTCYDLNE